MRRQTAIVWRRLTPDQYGQFTYGAPFQIACRWDDVDDNYTDAKGQINVSTTTMFPDQQLAIGDKAIQGELDSTIPLDPNLLAGVVEIKRFSIIPNFRNTENLYEALMA